MGYYGSLSHLYSGIISADDIFINLTCYIHSSVHARSSRKEFSHLKMPGEVTGEPKVLPYSFHYSL